MQISRIFFISLVLCSAVLCAGCTQPASLVTVAPVTGSAAVIDPAPLGLTLSDLPGGFTLAESRTKNASEMIRLALDMGWQGGYVARYITPAHDGTAGSEIIHSIAIYPEHTLPDVLEYTAQQTRSDSDFVYTEVPVQGLGGHARMFSAKAGTQIPVKSASNNPLLATMDTQEAPAILKKDFSVMIFSKGTIFEVIKISGPLPDPALLVNLSEKAYAKIP
jgi:hypothetical protein